VRLDLGRGELPCERLDLALLGAQIEVHAGEYSRSLNVRSDIFPPCNRDSSFAKRG
jgi:hypothetical protein